MKRYGVALLLSSLAGALAWSIGRPDEIPFEKRTLDLGASETCAVADVNGDGKPDIISGENWYEGPKWVKHKFRSIPFLNNYVDSFSDLPLDVNGDGHVDVVSCSWFGKRIWWNENPGKGRGGEWKEHSIQEGFNVEFAFLVDLDNDGKARELLPEFGGKSPTAWYELKNGAFVQHIVSPNNYGHGIGAGDINKDGRNDIITPKGWFEAPADPRTGEWKWHPDFDLGATGFIYVLDINGDGRNDIVTSLAHDYGVLWYEQTAAGKWVKRVIDDSWSQPHALTMVDLNKDGRMDFVTGKRYMAHNGRDPGEREPLGIYWYESIPTAKGVEWVKHVID